jgi:hypothetical protein
MNIKEEFDKRMAMKEEYLAGRLSMEDYSKWLNDFSIALKLIISAKKVIIDPNLAFRKKKGRETFSDRLAAVREENMVNNKKRGEDENERIRQKYAKAAQIEDDDIPF